MPCRCTGYRVEKCECKNGSPFLNNPIVYSASEFTDESFVLARTPLPSSRAEQTKKKSLLTIIVERMYENCAGYNLRHCHFRRNNNNKNHLINTLRDLLILCCFLLANFVVFMTIFSRIAFQLTFLAIETMKRIKSILKKKDETHNLHHHQLEDYDLDRHNIIPSQLQSQVTYRSDVY